MVYARYLYFTIKNFQIAVQDWDLVNIHEEAAKDVDELKTMMSSLFSDQSKSFDDILDTLGILNTQYFDTMSLLQQDQQYSLKFNEHVHQKLGQVCDLIAMRSSRKIKVQKHYLEIQFDDIRFLQSEPLEKDECSHTFPAIWQGEKVVVKIADRPIVSDDHIQAILKDADIWHHLNHKNVMHFWGMGLNTDRPFLVMPLLPNGSLCDYLSANPELNMKQRIKFMSDIAFGIAHLHQCGIIHADIKSSNVLVGFFD